MGNNRWMFSFCSARLGPIDARIFFVLLITLMHVTKFTIFLSIIAMIGLFYIERWKRITLPSALRWVVCSLTTFIFSPVRYARSIETRCSYRDTEALFRNKGRF